MTNLKIVRRNGKKEWGGKTYWDYTLLDETGYTFSILSRVEAPDDLECLPIIIGSYKGQPKIKVAVDMVVEYSKL